MPQLYMRTNFAADHDNFVVKIDIPDVAPVLLKLAIVLIQAERQVVFRTPLG